MKKFVFAFCMFALVGITTTQAQGFKGKWFLLGEAGYSTAADGKIKNYSILPVVGTFVAPTTALGIGVGYLGSKNETLANVVNKDQTFIVQPLARKYWGLSDNFLIFAQAAVPLTFGKTTVENDAGKVETKVNGYGLQLSPGVDYFFTSHFSMEASFGLVGWTAVKPKDGETSNDFGIGVNSGFQNGLKLGLKYIF